MAESLYAHHAISIDAEYDAGDSQLEGDSDDEDSDDLGTPAALSKRSRGRPGKSVLLKKHKHEGKQAEDKEASGGSGRAAMRPKKTTSSVLVVDSCSSDSEINPHPSGALAPLNLDSKTLAKIQQIDEGARAAKVVQDLCKAAASGGDGDISAAGETTHDELEKSAMHAATSASEMEGETAKGGGPQALAAKTLLTIARAGDKGKEKYKLALTEPMLKVFEKYCTVHELNRSAVKFMFDGAEVRDVQTPLELDMEADDENMLEARVKN